MPFACLSFIVSICVIIPHTCMPHLFLSDRNRPFEPTGGIFMCLSSPQQTRLLKVSLLQLSHGPLDAESKDGIDPKAIQQSIELIAAHPESLDDLLRL